MEKQRNRIIDIVTPGIAIGMSIAVIVVPLAGGDVIVEHLVRLHAIGILALGIFALNSLHRARSKDKEADKNKDKPNNIGK